jgi:MarR-like DNA-binding transcriptional regulator SgrR of sgrS sRNA
VLAAGLFVFFLVALAIGIGAFQQYYLKPRFAVAKVNGDTIEQQWYQKNLDYTRFTLSRDYQNKQNTLQALQVNVGANAAATAAANATAGNTPEPTSTPLATSTPLPAAVASVVATEVGTATLSPTPAPTFNPEQSATAASVRQDLNTDQTQFTSAETQTVQNLIDADLMRQNASKFGITVSQQEVSDREKTFTEQLGGDSALKDLFNNAHLSQGDFDQLTYNQLLRDKFQAYFADHPGDAPPPTPTTAPTAAPTTAAAGPQPPTPTATATPVPTPGADSLQRWLDQQESSAKISRAPFPLPSS